MIQGKEADPHPLRSLPTLIGSSPHTGYVCHWSTCIVALVSVGFISSAWLLILDNLLPTFFEERKALTQHGMRHSEPLFDHCTHEQL